MTDELTGLQQRILELEHALRRAGIPVAVSDGLDAMRAAGHVELLDRPQLREALAATLVKSPGHRRAFDRFFEVYFPARYGVLADEEAAEAERDSELGDEPAGLDRTPRDIGEFIEELIAQVLAGDEETIRALARQAVSEYGGVRDRDGRVSYFAYRVLGQFNLAGLLRRAIDEAGLDEVDELSRQLASDELRRALERFREEIDAEITRRQVEQRGADEVARTLVQALPEDLDFFRVSGDEQAEMRRQVRPLARKLASRVAMRRRRARDGRFDIRRTLRRSLGTGGVPVDPAFRHRHIHRPELVLICDVSGSVAAFARFTLMFCHALQGQFSKVRSFAFIDAIDEVTGLFSEGDFTDALSRLHTEAQVVRLDGHSDYGNALECFVDEYFEAVTPKTTVLVLGDARNNYRRSNSWVLGELRRNARRVYWLNPEPVGQWGSGDSIAGEYARHIDGMVECRNLRQLTEFVERVV